MNHCLKNYICITLFLYVRTSQWSSPVSVGHEHFGYKWGYAPDVEYTGLLGHGSSRLLVTTSHIGCGPESRCYIYIY